MVNKNLLLLVVGVAILGYGVLVMPPMTEHQDCTEHDLSTNPPTCTDSVTYEEENEGRFPTIVGGVSVTLVGGVLFFGDFV
jgi:hypothetical protein